MPFCSTLRENVTELSSSQEWVGREVKTKITKIKSAWFSVQLGFRFDENPAIICYKECTTQTNDPKYQMAITDAAEYSN